MFADGVVKHLRILSRGITPVAEHLSPHRLDFELRSPIHTNSSGSLFHLLPTGDFPTLSAPTHVSTIFLDRRLK